MILVPPFEIAERDDPDGARRLTLTGELDLASGPQLRERLSELHTARRAVRLDLSHLDFIDSTGIAIIARGLTHSASDDWKLEVDPNVPRQIARLIAIAGIAEKLWGERGEGGDARPGWAPPSADSGSTPRTRDKALLGPVGHPESQGTAPPLP
jgi:anti-sigma B factor antagonist